MAEVAMFPRAIATLTLCAVPVMGIAQPSSALCREIVGKTPKDTKNAQAICTEAYFAKGMVSGLIAMDSLLWVKLTPAAARAVRADRPSAEKVIKRWMTAWKGLSGSRAVTVYVEQGEAEIARGDTTLLRGDTVTFH